MKTLKCHLGLLFLAANIAAIGQITVDQSDMPSAGDTIRKSIGLDIDLTDPEDTGEDYLWDYSQLIPAVQVVDTFVTVTQTPFFYWPFFLLSANLASPLIQDSPFPQLPLTDVYGFFNKTGSKYEDVGFAATLFGIPLPFKYDDNDVLYKFPMNYGDVDSSESGYEFGIPDVAYIKVEKKRINTVDGWGTLLTPYGSFEVLRVKSEVTEYDSIYLDTLGIGVPVTREFIEYKWVGKGHGLPLLLVTDNLLGFVVEYIDSVRTITVGGEEDYPLVNTEASVFPNPTNKIINIKFEGSPGGEAVIRLYEMKGKCLFESKIFGTSRVTVDLEQLNLKPGQYLIKIDHNGKIITKKFVYQK